MTHDLEFAAGVVDSAAIDVLLNDMCSVPPPGFVPASAGLEGPPAALDGDPQHVCRACTETGVCGAAFHTRKALMNHYRAHHN
eukprot:734513-Pyramimonas_sp.AAC.1